MFGGWIPLAVDSDSKGTGQIYEREWKCTNTLAALNTGELASVLSICQSRVFAHLLFCYLSVLIYHYVNY